MADKTPYDNIARFVQQADLPTWVASKSDQLRVASYSLYDNIYKNVTGTFQLVARGTENNPIYVPSAKTIIEATNRYLAVDFDYSITGDTGGEAALAFDQFMRRQKFWSKFVTQKRYGLVRGDALWHVLFWNGQLRLQELDPRNYFPITAIDDVDEVIGCYIIKVMQDPANPNTTIVRRQAYRLTAPDPNNPAQPQTVTSELDYFDASHWDDRLDPTSLKPYQDAVVPLAPNSLRPSVKQFPLDPRIDRLPVYHIKNQRIPNEGFGLSELFGIERMVSAINQSISDEELALALEGLGLYATTSGPPTDDLGNPVNWVLGPGRVVELDPGSDFKRVGGVGSVEPNLAHIKFLLQQMKETTGVADIAVGMVDSVDSVQSGVALMLQMGPMLAKNHEKETEMIDEYDALFNDLLRKWFAVYGIGNFPNVDMTPVVGDPMPVDRNAIITEVSDLLTMRVITVVEAQSILHDKLGYDFKLSSPEDLLEQEAAWTVARDPFGRRIADELGLDAADQRDATNNGATQPNGPATQAAGGPTTSQGA